MNLSIKEAAERIRAGELVAFPTETVYGLGANALDAAAVAKIYELKGRPPASPLSVHAGSIEMARALVTEWPPEAEQLAQKYWPGPLTLVLPKAPSIPDIVTAGLWTVGVRVPAHPIALALIVLIVGAGRMYWRSRTARQKLAQLLDRDRHRGTAHS